MIIKRKMTVSTFTWFKWHSLLLGSISWSCSTVTTVSVYLFRTQTHLHSHCDACSAHKVYARSQNVQCRYTYKRKYAVCECGSSQLRNYRYGNSCMRLLFPAARSWFSQKPSVECRHVFYVDFSDCFSSVFSCACLFACYYFCTILLIKFTHILYYFFFRLFVLSFFFVVESRAKFLSEFHTAPKIA